MKLFMVHTGFYDKKISRGIFEFHTNYFIVAENHIKAKEKILNKSEFKKRNMHIDGIIEINNIDGFKIDLIKTAENEDIKCYDHDEIKKNK